MKKLAIGWFSFSCCEDSTIIFTELLNEHFEDWRRVLDFKAFRPLQKREEIKDIDVAFVEGAITSLVHEAKLKQIRAASKKLVAVGACAVAGMPSAQRNHFNEQQKAEIEAILMRFQYAPLVKKVSDVVLVDAVVNGCPMEEKTFLTILEQYLVEFGIRGNV